MRPMITLAALLALLVAASGCGSKSTTSETTQTGAATTPEPATPPQGDGHAVASVVPGSSEPVAVTSVARCGARALSSSTV